MSGVLGLAAKNFATDSDNVEEKSVLSPKKIVVPPGNEPAKVEKLIDKPVAKVTTKVDGTFDKSRYS